MARLSLQSLATALLCLTPKIPASPIPEAEETTYTTPIGVPNGGFTTQFYGPTPDILTLSLETFSISNASNATEAPPYQPEDVELLDDPELDKRFVKGTDNRVLWTNKG